jgi:membrane protease YdiL (CAAX protease family)
MEPTEEQKQPQSLPFNNLFLNAGVVNGFNFFWMYLTGICLAVLGYVLFQFFMIIPLLAAALKSGFSLTQIQADPLMLYDPGKIGINKNFFLALLLGMFVFALVGLYLAVTKIHRKPFKSIITAWDNVRWKRFFFAFVIWGIFCVLNVVLGYFLNKEEVTVQFDPSKFFILVLVAVTLMPIQTSTEELIFRGYLMQGISQITKNGMTPLIITSLLFGYVHMSNPEAQTFGWAVMLPYYAAFGFFLGAITLLDEGLELAMGVHCANNVISSLMITSPTGVLKTDAIFATSKDNPALEMGAWLVMATITFIIFWQKYRWKNFTLLIK